MRKQKLTGLTQRWVDSSKVCLTEKDRYDQLVRQTEEKLMTPDPAPGVYSQLLGGQRNLSRDVQFYLNYGGSDIAYQLARPGRAVGKAQALNAIQALHNLIERSALRFATITGIPAEYLTAGMQVTVGTEVWTVLGDDRADEEGVRRPAGVLDVDSYGHNNREALAKERELWRAARNRCAGNRSHAPGARVGHGRVRRVRAR